MEKSYFIHEKGLSNVTDLEQDRLQSRFGLGFG